MSHFYCNRLSIVLQDCVWALVHTDSQSFDDMSVSRSSLHALFVWVELDSNSSDTAPWLKLTLVLDINIYMEIILARSNKASELKEIKTHGILAYDFFQWHHAVWVW